LSNKYLKLGLLFFALIIIQISIFNNVSLFGYAQPMVYILFVFLYPITKKRILFLLLSFLLGLSIDFFSNSGGINAAATLFIAYYRMPILKQITRKTEFDPILFNLKSLTLNKRISYLFILTFIHHFIVFQLSYFKLSAFKIVFLDTVFSSIYTCVLLLFYISLFLNKKR